MSLESLAIALGIASFVLAIASAVLAISSSAWQWRIFRDAQDSQRDASTLMAKVSEKLDLVATHTSHQVDKAFDVIAQQLMPARQAAAEYERSIDARDSAAVSPGGDMTVALVALDATWFEVSMLASEYLEPIPGCKDIRLRDAIPAFAADLAGDSREPSRFVVDLLALQDAHEKAIAGQLDERQVAEALSHAMRLAAFLRPRVEVTGRFAPHAGA